MEVQANLTEVQSNETEVQANQTEVQNNITLSPEEINAKNAAESTGKVESDGGSAMFYTADQVKAMTPAQVRANYPRIIESMKCRTFFE